MGENMIQVPDKSELTGGLLELNSTALYNCVEQQKHLRTHITLNLDMCYTSHHGIQG